MKKLLFILMIFCGLNSLPAGAVTDGRTPFYIPPGQFNAAMQIMDLGFANVFGLFRNATGSFTFEESTKTVSNLRLAIDATSILASNAENQHDIENLLAIYEFPEIAVQAPESYSFTEGKADIKATLTMHGISKPVVLTATINHVGNSPHGGGMWAREGQAIGLSMRGTIKTSDFSLGSNTSGGAARFGDNLTLMLETQAIQQ
jgi:polyisoprenoid-binding protein YceI